MFYRRVLKFLYQIKTKLPVREFTRTSLMSLAFYLSKGIHQPVKSKQTFSEISVYHMELSFKLDGLHIGKYKAVKKCWRYVYKIEKSGWIGEMITECGIHAA